MTPNIELAARKLAEEIAFGFHREYAVDAIASRIVGCLTTHTQSLEEENKRLKKESEGWRKVLAKNSSDAENELREENKRLREALDNLAKATRNTLETHPETACCSVTWVYVKEAEALTKPT